MLSVTAKPFHPVHGKEIDTIIYNDGIPSASFSGSESELLTMITDETIDEAFPPSAQDAAELEAVEIFVEMLATLSHLEEREEKTRFDPAHPDSFFGKRWHSRRELVDKPRPAKHSITPVVHRNQHESNDAPAKNKESLVDYNLSQSLSVRDHKSHQREISRMTRHTMSNKNKQNWNRHQQKANNSIPVHQPRKFN